jgi:hypothetical protein
VKRYWTRFRALSWWKQALGWVGASIALPFVIGIIGSIVDSGETDQSSDSEETTEAPTTTQTEATTTETEQEPTEPKPAPAPARVSEPEPTQEDLQNALDDVDPTEFGAVSTGLEVKRIERLPLIVHVTLATPEGGFEGPSVADIDGSAAGAFKAIYEDAGWRRDATVTFTGGLVNTRTGQDLPNAETGIYRLTAKEARRIDWDNAIAVDWSLYRVFASPALKD